LRVSDNQIGRLAWNTDKETVMSDIPTTIEGESGGVARTGWNDAAELHKCEDGGGLFHRFKTIRRGTLAELISFVLSMPDEQQGNYAIQKEGDHQLRIGEIRHLARRADFPSARL
jgi:hypothetical protein